MVSSLYLDALMLNFNNKWKQWEREGNITCNKTKIDCRQVTFITIDPGQINDGCRWPRPSLVFVDHCRTDGLRNRERPTHVTPGNMSFLTGPAVICFYCRTRLTRIRGYSVCPGGRQFFDRPGELKEKNVIQPLCLRAARFR